MAVVIGCPCCLSVFFKGLCSVALLWPSYLEELLMAQIVVWTILLILMWLFLPRALSLILLVKTLCCNSMGAWWLIALVLGLTGWPGGWVCFGFFAKLIGWFVCCFVGLRSGGVPVVFGLLKLVCCDGWFFVGSVLGCPGGSWHRGNGSFLVVSGFFCEILDSYWFIFS